MIPETACSPGASCGGLHVGPPWASPAFTGLAIAHLAPHPPHPLDRRGWRVPVEAMSPSFLDPPPLCTLSGPSLSSLPLP